MKPSRRLAIHREQLAELHTDELAGVVPGTGVTSLYRCHTYELTCWGCPVTLPLDQCRIDTR